MIVSRLLLPGQRVGHDSRVNPAMADQMGNYYQGSLAVQSGDTVYYVYRNDDADEIGVTARKAGRQHGAALYLRPRAGQSLPR